MIPVVGAGFAERGEPEGVDAEIFQIGEFFRDGAEVPSQELRLEPIFGGNARKSVDQQMIDDCVLKPVGWRHG